MAWRSSQSRHTRHQAIKASTSLSVSIGFVTASINPQHILELASVKFLSHFQCSEGWSFVSTDTSSIFVHDRRLHLFYVFIRKYEIQQWGAACCEQWVQNFLSSCRCLSIERTLRMTKRYLPLGSRQQTAFYSSCSLWVTQQTANRHSWSILLPLLEVVEEVVLLLALRCIRAYCWPVRVHRLRPHRDFNSTRAPSEKVHFFRLIPC